MTTTVILFDSNGSDHEASIDSFYRAVGLQADGFPVKVTIVETHWAKVTSLMWINFETEEEAALFKLTHL